MSERLALAIGALAAKTAYRLLKKQKKKTPPPPPEKGGEERRQPQEKRDIDILREEIQKQTGNPLKKLPWYSGLPHGTYTREGYRKRWVFRTTDLGTPQQWARFLAPYIDVLYSPRQDGGIYHLPIIFATTGIILTRDGRLLALPQGETSFEIATKIWKLSLIHI
ncbi:MAG: hypothetical protein GSR72_01455, partial [Desulfurococcales archaeon]|nr:hypothetical protein [Desulfurococcales archaeon]